MDDGSASRRCAATESDAQCRRRWGPSAKLALHINAGSMSCTAISSNRPHQPADSASDAMRFYLRDVHITYAYKTCVHLASAISAIFFFCGPTPSANDLSPINEEPLRSCALFEERYRNVYIYVHAWRRAERSAVAQSSLEQRHHPDV